MYWTAVGVGQACRSCAYGVAVQSACFCATTAVLYYGFRGVVLAVCAACAAFGKVSIG